MEARPNSVTKATALKTSIFTKLSFLKLHPKISFSTPVQYDSSHRYVSLSDGTTANRLDIVYWQNTANQITARLTVGGVQQARYDIIISNELLYNKFALSWKTNQIKFFINGQQQGTTDTSASVPPANTFNTLNFDRGDGLEPFYGKIRDIRVYNTKEMTDSEVDILLTKITS